MGLYNSKYNDSITYHDGNQGWLSSNEYLVTIDPENMVNQWIPWTKNGYWILDDQW